MIKTKSVYDRPEREDGYRILIEPTWPKGIARKAASCEWMKSLAPSRDLCGWMSRNPRKFESFRSLYLVELGRNDAAMDRVCAMHRERGAVTFLYVPNDDGWDIPRLVAQYARAHCGVD